MVRFKAWKTEDLLQNEFKTLDKNKRVSNAKKTEVDNILFDSKLEANMYLALKNLHIPHERQHTIILQPQFKDTDGKTVRAIKWIVDFYFPWCETILDTKGYATEVAKIKIKIFKNIYLNSLGVLYPARHENEINIIYKRLIIVTKMKDIDSITLQLLSEWQQQKT